MRTRVETKGSIWLLDDDRGQYARMPKHEGPRLSPEGEDWGGDDAGILQDLVWHPMERWEIRVDPIMAAKPSWPLGDELPTIEWVDTGKTQAILIIHADGPDAVVAPDAVVLDG